MRFDSPAPRRRLISLTPLIDVVFILLVFFMLASSLVKWHSVEMGASASATAGPPVVGSWLVRVRPVDLDLNAEPISTAELAVRVSARLGEVPAQHFLVQPGAGVTLQRLVDVLDLLRAAGATHLTLLRL
jgi:biopolymer transport protein ExbD